MRYLTIALLVAGSTAVAWSPPERVDRRPDNYVVYGNDIAVGPDGTPHIVWSECPRETYFEMIKYSRRDHDTWTIPINISRDSGDFRQPAIVVDSSGVPLVVWTEEYSGRVRYVRQLGDTWSLPKLCFPTRGITPRLAIDSRNRIHLLFEKYGRPGVIWYSYYISAADSWAHPCTVATAPFELGWSDLTVDRQDHLHAVWMSWATLNIEYSFNDGTGWSATEEVPNPAPGTQAAVPRVATDTFNQPHVVWDETWVYYSYKDGDTWTAARRLYEDWGGSPVICSDSLNQLHVVWDWDYGMRYIARRASGWTQPESLTSSRGGALPEMAVKHGLVHLTWRGVDWHQYYSQNPVSGALAEGMTPRGRGVRLRPAGVTRGELVLTYELSEGSDVTLAVFDISGRCIRRIGPRRETAGHHTIRLPVAALGDSGLWILRLDIGKDVETVKAVVLK